MEALRARVRAHLARFERRAHPTEGLRRAAVALPLLEDSEGRACFLITRRTAKLPRHPNQFAFPGGRLDPGESPHAAALRELREEVGLKLGQEHVLGLLDDYTTRSGYVITPFVVFAPSCADVAPDPDEVQAAHLIPLAELEHREVPRLRTIAESDRPVLSVPLDRALGTTIHAPTAALLFQLREVAIHGRATRVAHYDAPVFAWR